MGPYCKENPCQNGGQCIDSLDGPICECESGFKGERFVIINLLNISLYFPQECLTEHFCCLGA